MTTLWRCAKRSRLGEAFTGEGGRLYSGRWHSKGTPILYTSDEASFSLVEILVHGGPLDVVLELYALTSCEIPERLIMTVPDSELPDGWDAPEPIGATQAWGDAWLASSECVAVRVPSAVMPGTNVLVNPRHEGFRHLVPSESHLEWDPRLTTVHP